MSGHPAFLFPGALETVRRRLQYVARTKKKQVADVVFESFSSMSGNKNLLLPNNARWLKTLGQTVRKPLSFHRFFVQRFSYLLGHMRLSRSNQQEGALASILFFSAFLFVEGRGNVPSLSVQVGVEERFNIGKKIRTNAFSCNSSERNAHKSLNRLPECFSWTHLSSALWHCSPYGIRLCLRRW